jgi:DNA-binding GntR family transcriptional regulator
MIEISGKVEARSLVEAVTERLEAAIVAGELTPGARISEQALARAMGVSRGPLREAVRRLEGRRLLERKANIGVRVAELSPERLYDLMTVREAMEGMACRLAADRLSEKDLAALDGLLSVHAEQNGIQAGSGYYQGSGDYDFHARIAIASGNALLHSMICGDLYDLLRIYRYKSSTVPGRAAAALEEHREILRVLRARDADAAEAAMRAHIRAAREHAMLAMAAAGDAPDAQPVA